MWRQAGLNVNDDSQCFVIHPRDPTDVLYFMADVPHPIKSVKNCYENQVLLLNEDTIKSNRLPFRGASK